MNIPTPGQIYRRGRETRLVQSVDDRYVYAECKGNYAYNRVQSPLHQWLKWAAKAELESSRAVGA